MSNREKSHGTSLRILEVLKILLNEDLTKNELIQKLQEKSNINGVYTQEAFLKYFNTFEKAGLSLNKNKCKYGLKNAVLHLNLTKPEQKMLEKVIESAEKLNNKNNEEVFKQFIPRLDKYVDTDLKELLKKSPDTNKSAWENNVKYNVISSLKNMLSDNQQVEITYTKSNNTEETILVELKEIVEQNENIYVIAYNRNLSRNKKININNIIELKQSPKKVIGDIYNNQVMFEIYGRLIKNYKLKPNETVVDFRPNYNLVSNKGEDKDVLLLRLLKYGENCKIIRPLSFKREFMEMTDKILKNLEDS